MPVHRAAEGGGGAAAARGGGARDRQPRDQRVVHEELLDGTGVPPRERQRCPGEVMVVVCCIIIVIC